MSNEAKVEEYRAVQDMVVKEESLPQLQAEQLPVAQVSEASGLMTLVERLAVDKEIDPDRIERAFSMYKEVRSMDAQQAFNLAMSKAQAEIEPVAANKVNDHTKSAFANLSAVHKVCKPIWTAHGFSVSSSYYECEKEGWIGVDCEVMHSGGFVKRYKNPYPLDIAGSGGKVNKTAIQAIGSTGSYARRYVELMVFDVSIGDDNDGNATATSKLKPAEQPLTQAMIKNLRDAMTVANVSDQKMCEKAEVEKIEDIQQGNMQRCKTWLLKVAQS